MKSRTIFSFLPVFALALSPSFAHADDPITTPIPSYTYRCALGDSVLMDYASSETNPNLADAKVELGPKDPAQRAVLATSTSNGATSEVALQMIREGQGISVIVATDKNSATTSEHSVHLAFSFKDGEVPPTWVHAESPISLDEETTVRVRKGFFRRLFSKEKYDVRTQVTSKQVLAEYAVVCARFDSSLGN